MSRDSGETRPIYGGGRYADKDAEVVEERQSRRWLFGAVIGFITGIFVLVTLVSVLVFDGYAHRGLNIYFGVCILLICVSHLITMYWFGKGVLDDRVRPLLYYNAICLILLCICANCFMHKT